MRSQPDALLITALAVFAVTGLAGTALMYREPPVIDPVPMFVGGDPSPLTGGALTGAESGAQWFAGIRGFCNPVDVETRLRWQPAPESEDGTMHEAACYALAGKVELARASVLRLPPDRGRASGRGCSTCSCSVAQRCPGASSRGALTRAISASTLLKPSCTRPVARPSVCCWRRWPLRRSGD